VLGRELRHHVGGDRRGVAERLVEVPGQVLDDADDVWPQDEVVMVRGKLLGDDARVIELVEARFREADRERLEASLVRLGHHADHGARVEAAAEEGANRHVADLVQRHRLGQDLAQLFDQLAFGGALVRLELHVPVAGGGEWTSRAGHRHVRGLELLDAVDDAGVAGRRESCEEMADRFPVERALDVRQREDRL
jgi:hypothetical protein